MKRFNRIVQGTTKFGFTFSGIYGERNDSIGNIFQITNQITLGVTEADTMEQLRKIVTQIVQEEQNCRTLVWDHNKNNLKDKWLRTWGTLSQAWLLDDRETLNFASDFASVSTWGSSPCSLWLMKPLWPLQILLGSNFRQGQN